MRRLVVQRGLSYVLGAVAPAAILAIIGELVK
jgi:hypothetical protein